MNSTEFSVLPPHFNFPLLDGSGGGGGGGGGGGMVISAVEREINNAVSNLIVGGHLMSPQKFQILANCFASIFYHYDYLD